MNQVSMSILQSFRFISCALAIGAGIWGCSSGDPTGSGGNGSASSSGSGGCIACPEPSDGCKVATCENGVCGEGIVADGTPTNVQAPGDCKKTVCMAGTAVSSPDDSDAPDVPGDCKIQSCAGGSVVESFEPLDTPCGTNGAAFCDGNGTCFGCTGPLDCVDPGVCQMATCDMGKCGVALDPIDVEIDGNDCTEDLCAGSVPNHPNKAAGSFCGNGGMCDASGHCVGTACPQNACPSGTTCVDGVCCNEACVGTCRACNIAGKVGICSNYAAFEDPGDLECPGVSLACDGKGACKKHEGQTCVTNDECLGADCIDGFCCLGPCSDLCQSCNVPGNLGFCTQIPAGQDPANECIGGATCNGSGSCLLFTLGVPCAQNGECQSDKCVDGVCCAIACSGECKACTTAKTGLPEGICGNYALDTDPDNECTTECNGIGACKAANGAICGMDFECQSGFCVDGVCCENDCSGFCQACSATKKGQGTNGVCGPVKTGIDPDNECMDQGAAACATDGFCDGGGACRNYNPGAFPTSTTFGVAGAYSLPMVVEDVNGDGKPDIVLGQPTFNLVRVILNNGNGGFATSTAYPVAGTYSLPMVVEDVNGDNKADIVLGHPTLNLVRVMLNDGSGGFANSTTYPVAGTFSLPLEVQDVTADGVRDIVLGHPTLNQVRVMVNDGSGAFPNSKTYSTTVTFSMPMELEDLNGDGKPDMVLGQPSVNLVRVMLNSCQ